MALSDSQRAKVRRYLGYPDVNRRLFSDLEGALAAVSAEGETEVTDLLTKLGNIEDTLVSAQSRQKVIKAEDVTLAGRDEIRALCSEGNRYAVTLASLLDVTPRRLPFSSGSQSGVARRG